MAELVSAAVVATLAAGQFVVTELTKSAAGETGKQLMTALWGKLKARFQGDDRATEALTAVETEKSAEALADLTTYVKSEMKRSPEFATEVQQMAQQILNLDQSQTQTAKTFNTEARDQARVVVVGEDLNATTLNLGDHRP